MWKKKKKWILGNPTKKMFRDNDMLLKQTMVALILSVDRLRIRLQCWWQRNRRDGFTAIRKFNFAFSTDNHSKLIKVPANQEKIYCYTIIR